MRLRTLMSAAVATVAVSAPFVATAAPAQAAHRPGPWERIARCESGGRWHINTHNGYYGGLQISLSTWRGYGGRHFAQLPSRATKGEQIRIGQRIRQGQGWGAWPVCSVRAGLR